jgi:hypothetical protein
LFSFFTFFSSQNPFLLPLHLSPQAAPSSAAPTAPAHKHVPEEFICPLDWCAKEYKSQSGLSGHIRTIHRRPSPSWVKPNASDVNDFTTRVTFAIQEVLGRTPKRTIGRNRSGGAFERVELDCSRAVFLELFEDLRGFRMSKDQQRFNITFSGLDGRKELEGVLGQRFWKHTFNNRDRSQCFAHFYNYSSKTNHPMTFSWSTKTVINHNPESVFTRERVQIRFKRFRTTESSYDRAHCTAFVPVIRAD